MLTDNYKKYIREYRCKNKKCIDYTDEYYDRCNRVWYYDFQQMTIMIDVIVYGIMIFNR